MTQPYAVKVVLLPHGVSLPKKMTDQASGYDLFAAVDADVLLEPRQRHGIPTGIALAMPPTLEAQIRPRSGLALKHGITTLNAPGTIDADYRGEIVVLLINHGEQTFVIRRGERIAQLVFQSIPAIEWHVEATLVDDDTTRGRGGFGHTGV